MVTAHSIRYVHWLDWAFKLQLKNAYCNSTSYYCYTSNWTSYARARAEEGTKNGNILTLAHTSGDQPQIMIHDCILFFALNMPNTRWSNCSAHDCVTVTFEWAIDDGHKLVQISLNKMHNVTETLPTFDQFSYDKNCVAIIKPVFYFNVDNLVKAIGSIAEMPPGFQHFFSWYHTTFDSVH